MANPEAIAWYVERSEDLLDQLRERVQALRSRGGQLAGVFLMIGVLLLIASLATALGGTLVPRLASDISAQEVFYYSSERFTHEPDLWRVHVRTLRAVLGAIEWTTLQGDKVAFAVRKAEYLFLTGLFSVAVALGTLIVVMTF